jgi:Tfp pilus assembly protein PilF
MIIGCHFTEQSTGEQQTVTNSTESQVSSVERRYQLDIEHLEATSKLRAEDFEDLVKEAPTLPEAHLLLGNIYAAAGTPDHLEKAINEYDKAIALRANYTAAYINRGVAKYLSNDITRACSH